MSHSNYETFISVREDIECLAAILGGQIKHDRDEIGPVRYVDAKSDRASFTIFTYRDDPTRVRILSDHPDDDGCLVEFISQLGVDPEAIEFEDDHIEAPSRDLEAIREAVLEYRRRNWN